jgi:hypothetical protein
MNSTVIERISDRFFSPSATQILDQYGLKAVIVAWEDNARDRASSEGPSTTDVTLVTPDIRGDIEPATIIRHSNHEDITADIAAENLSIMVGNEKRGRLVSRISLQEYLSNIDSYLTHKPRWMSLRRSSSFFVEGRDQNILVSTQACVLPRNAAAPTKFGIRISNHQTTEGGSGMLAIVASLQGTSAQIILNDEQILYHNKGGVKVLHTATGLSAHRLMNGAVDTDDVMTNEEENRNFMYIILVPLKHPVPARSTHRSRSRRTAPYLYVDDNDTNEDDTVSRKCRVCVNIEGQTKSIGSEPAIIDTDEMSFGPFSELPLYRVERDSRYPIRVVIQHFIVADDAKFDERVAKEISERFQSIRDLGVHVGSLVTNPPGLRTTEITDPVETGQSTEEEFVPYTPRWWNLFWDCHGKEFEHEISKEEAHGFLFTSEKFRNKSYSRCMGRALALLRGKENKSGLMLGPPDPERGIVGMIGIK